jgi:hypothetical protein
LLGISKLPEPFKPIKPAFVITATPPPVRRNHRSISRSILGELFNTVDDPLQSVGHRFRREIIRSINFR